MNNNEFFNELEKKEQSTILMFARIYLGEFCFRGLGEPEPAVASLPETLQDCYYNLWTKLDIHITRNN